MLRTLGSVFGGWMAVQILVLLTDRVLSRMFPEAYTGTGALTSQLMLTQLALNTIYSILGGWITARVAVVERWKHVLYLGIWGETLGLFMAVQMLGQGPLWYIVGLLVCWPAAVALGGWICLGKG